MAILDVSWQNRAACHGMDRNIFFPGSRDVDGQEKAKAVCRLCPVQRPCLAWAQSFGLAHSGIAGGMTEQERARRRRSDYKQTRKQVA